jgi:hypothetical protein
MVEEKERKKDDDRHRNEIDGKEQSKRTKWHTNYSYMIEPTNKCLDSN